LAKSFQTATSFGSSTDWTDALLEQTAAAFAS